jgi:hypothetical protein
MRGRSSGKTGPPVPGLTRVGGGATMAGVGVFEKNADQPTRPLVSLAPPARAPDRGGLAAVAARDLPAKLCAHDESDSDIFPSSSPLPRLLLLLRTSHDAAPGTEVPDSWLAPR